MLVPPIWFAQVSLIVDLQFTFLNYSLLVFYSILFAQICLRSTLNVLYFPKLSKLTNYSVLLADTVLVPLWFLIRFIASNHSHIHDVLHLQRLSLWIDSIGVPMGRYLISLRVTLNTFFSGRRRGEEPIDIIFFTSKS